MANVTLRISEVELPIDVAGECDGPLRKHLEHLGIPREAPMQVVKRALDARSRPPKHVYSVAVAVEAGLAGKLEGRANVSAYQPIRYAPLRLPRPVDGPTPVVVGAGPAGLFAALTLAEAGLAPIVLERGRGVETRGRDVSKLYSTGKLDPDSNVCFGEGGAGTYSDGKLYTRVGDSRVHHVMERLVAHGARDDILFVNRPHIGTDKLVRILRSVRTRLESLGAILRYETAVEDFEVKDGKLNALRLRGGERIETKQVVLATGHSAREIWQRLEALGLPLESRPFAVGFRVEHAQELIDQARYGKHTIRDLLPAADYKLTYNEGQGDSHRGVYSFCMCPGGVVVTTPTREGELCINGMSHASRRGRYANSALVVSVTPKDLAKWGYSGLFAGVELQQDAERKAYAAGGGKFVAPASRLTDFAAGRGSSTLEASSYRRGLTASTLDELYPAPVNEALRRALGRFDQKLRGFQTDEATLIGVETRTASPIRVPRSDHLEALGCDGLYPAGEGMGYGGGIVSAAVDGVRVAEAILSSHGATAETPHRLAAETRAKQ